MSENGFIWHVLSDDIYATKWDITQAFLARNPLNTVYIVFGKHGYMTYYDAAGLSAPMVVTVKMLKPIPSQGLLLPWEVFGEEDGNNPVEPTGKEYDFIWNARGEVSIDPKAKPIDTGEPLGRQLQIYADFLWYEKTGTYPNRPLLGNRDWTVLYSMTEQDVIRSLMQTEHYKAALENGSLWREPLPEDIRAFMARHRVSLAQGPSAFPSLIFVIPYEEYPIGVMYAGGTARLSFRDVPYWLQAKEQRIEQHDLPKRAFVELYDECLGDFSRVLGGRLLDIWEKLPPSIGESNTLPGSKRTKGNRALGTVVGVITDTTDIEDLIHKSPPCIKQLLKQKRWYKDKERNQLVHQLKAGGANRDLIKKVFERAASHAKHDDGEWDWRYAWKTQTNYAQCCSTIIANTKEKQMQIITCPFAFSQQTPQMLCLDKMQKRFPEKRTKMTRLWTPAQWYVEEQHQETKK